MCTVVSYVRSDFRIAALLCVSSVLQFSKVNGCLPSGLVCFLVVWLGVWRLQPGAWHVIGLCRPPAWLCALPALPQLLSPVFDAPQPFSLLRPQFMAPFAPR